MSWSSYQTPDVVARRAGGRRKHNARRKAQAWARRAQILELCGTKVMLLGAKYARGITAELAARLGVHRTTITRDLFALRVEWWRSIHSAENKQ